VSECAPPVCPQDGERSPGATTQEKERDNRLIRLDFSADGVARTTIAPRRSEHHRTSHAITGDRAAPEGKAEEKPKGERDEF